MLAHSGSDGNRYVNLFYCSIVNLDSFRIHALKIHLKTEPGSALAASAGALLSFKVWRIQS